MLNLKAIGSLRSVKSVKPNGLGHCGPNGLTLLTLLRLPIAFRFNTFNTS